MLKIETEKLAISRSLFQLIEVPEQKKLRSNGFLTRESLCKERRSKNWQLITLLKSDILFIVENKRS